MVLQVFAQRVCNGEVAANKNPIQARSTEDYTWHVAQTLLGLGVPDPHLNYAGDIHFSLRRIISAWKKEDPPPHYIKPIHVQVINHIAVIAKYSQCPTTKSITDIIIISFFFLLLHTGVSTDIKSKSTPFHLEDTVKMGNGSLDPDN